MTEDNYAAPRARPALLALFSALLPSLDGDRTGELFTFGRSLEGVRYRIYKRTAGRWRRLEEFYVYRCAY